MQTGMEKIKQYWVLVTVCLLVLAGFFYWSGYGPYKARKDCAWKQGHQDAVPFQSAQGDPGEVALKNSCVENCKKITNGSIDRLLCVNECEKSHQYEPAKEAQPAKDWWEPTTEREYKECLRGKGF